MSFFSRLFSTPDAEAIASPTCPETETVAGPTGPDIVPEELFVDREVNDRPAPTEVATPLARELASMDRTEEGRRAGYDYHDMDICRQMKVRIRSEIRVVVEREMDQLGMLVDQLDVEIRRLHDADMPATLAQMQARREQIEQHRMRLHEQQFLIAANGGFAELPISTFDEGFKLGYRAYLEATDLINQFHG